MSDETGDSLDALGCDVLVKTKAAQVCIWRSTRDGYDELEDRIKGRLERVMTLWCDNQRLTPEMFNANEGRSPKNNLLQAFKTFKCRLYGFVRTVKGTKTFIIVDIDPAKKKDKADPGILKRAKSRVDDAA
jgi:hypothetical protein